MLENIVISKLDHLTPCETPYCYKNILTNKLVFDSPSFRSRIKIFKEGLCHLYHLFNIPKQYLQLQTTCLWKRPLKTPMNIHYSSWICILWVHCKGGLHDCVLQDSWKRNEMMSRARGKTEEFLWARFESSIIHLSSLGQQFRQPQTSNLWAYMLATHLNAHLWTPAYSTTRTFQGRYTKFHTDLTGCLDEGKWIIC